MRVSVAGKIGLGFASLVAVTTVSSLLVYQKVRPYFAGRSE